MEIENIENMNIIEGDELYQHKQLEYISTVSGNIIQIAQNGKPKVKLTLNTQDILKLMTWLVGQEKHTQEELALLRKKVNGMIWNKDGSFYAYDQGKTTKLTESDVILDKDKPKLKSVAFLPILLSASNEQKATIDTLLRGYTAEGFIKQLSK